MYSHHTRVCSSMGRWSLQLVHARGATRFRLMVECLGLTVQESTRCLQSYELAEQWSQEHLVSINLQPETIKTAKTQP